MAEGVVSEIAAKILEVLGSQVFQEIKSAFGVQDGIEKLTDTVSTLKDLLADADNAPVTELLRRLKDALYDADDLLDDFATQLKQREMITGNKLTKEVRIFFSRSNQIAYSLNISHKIKAVREKLERIKKDKEFCNTFKTSVEKPVENRSERVETHSRLPELVIGRDDDKNKILKLLLESNDTENVSFIPVVGMGGLGKTTLAKLVCNDEQVQRHFQLRMWVCVSDQFHVKAIVKNIIESATNRKTEELPMEQLQRRLREEIDTKKYLLVLDDIWNEDTEKWAQLKDLLINGIRGSKILVTTRSHEAANIINKHLCYSLEGLDKDKSWSLFSQVAFEKGKVPEDSERLVKIGEEIVEKCGGVPLVISTIGRLLYYVNFTEECWSSFKDNELSKKIKEESDILPTLKLSYYHLPSNLKQCFAYCALFPKDFEIDKQQLISLWMAQGFLQSSLNEGQCLKDVGNKYFMDLLMRSFFQDPRYDDDGNVITCKMHDLVHDLAGKVAGVECTMATFSINSVDTRCRHLSLHCGDVDEQWKFPNVLLAAKQIRTLLLFVGSYVDYKWNDHHKIFSSYSRLRALDFSIFDFETLSGGIGKLTHLRYLNLSQNTKIEKLPNSISKLQNLETLDLYECTSLQELPRGIRKMVNLKDLIIKGCKSLIGLPRGLGALTSLETMSFFIVTKRNKRDYRKYGALEELCGLKKLRGKLEIRNLRHVDNARQEKYLEKMQFLRFLKLKWDDGSGSETDRLDEVALESLKPHPNLKEIKIVKFTGVKLSSWLSSITNLTSITLRMCKRCRYIPQLEELPLLKRLFVSYLDDLEYLSEKAINSSTTLSTAFFPSLEELTLAQCHKLKGWWRRDDDDNDEATEQMTELPIFSCLSKLKIILCPNLTSMPLYPSLEELYLWKTSSKPLQQTMRMMKNNVGPSTSTSSRLSDSASLSKLKSLTLSLIDDLKCVPEDWLRNLTSLKHLKIKYCRRLSQLFQGMRFLTSLQYLEIRDCEELEYLASDEDNDDMKCQGLRSLRSLKLEGLPKLESLSTNELQFVTSLQDLYISDCENLKALPEWTCNLTLRSLYLSGVPKLESLPKWLQFLTTLQDLTLHNCPNLKALLESLPTNELQFVTSLQHLSITDCENLKALPEWTCNLTLRSLLLSRVPKLESLPKWLQFLTTLQDLTLHSCPNLKALPESMCNLTSLYISGCPQLSENCGNNRGKDWPKIAHIPNIKIDGKDIQEEGRYVLNSEEDADEDDQACR